MENSNKKTVLISVAASAVTTVLILIGFVKFVLPFLMVCLINKDGFIF